MGLFDFLKGKKNEPDTTNNMNAGVSNEEKCGSAWLQIAGGRNREKGLATMKALGNNGFDEGCLAYAMFANDQDERENFLKKAADAGNAEAMWQYSDYLDHSYAADSGDEEDEEWLKVVTGAAKGGSVDAMNELGNIFHRQGKYPQSMYWYTMANAYGHPAGQMSMSGLAREWKNSGMPYDDVEETQDFNKAMYECSMSYLELHAGIPMKKSVNDIFKYVLDGTPIAAYLAGDIYESQDMLEMAYKTYNAISFENDPHGLKCYADMLMTGRGTQQDFNGAMKAYEKAAIAGDRESMFVMGEKYRTSNKKMAAYWYGKAYARGYEPAETRLLQLS